MIQISDNSRVSLCLSASSLSPSLSNSLISKICVVCFPYGFNKAWMSSKSVSSLVCTTTPTTNKNKRKEEKSDTTRKTQAWMWLR